jgi:hypothetical protein
VADDAPLDAVLDAALDGLFEVVPEEFVSTRDRIAGDLKAAGHGDVAAQVKRTRRPTLATWSLNQLGRDDAGAVDAYLEASRVLRRLQEHGGDRDELLTAMRGHRDAQHALADLAVGHAGTRPGDAERVRGAVQETLEAAALDDRIADALRRGRLTSTERAVSAFDVLDVQPAPGPVDTGEKSGNRMARRPVVDRVREQQARARLDAARQASTAARAALKEAERLVQQRRKELDDADQAERAAREELERAREAR